MSEPMPSKRRATNSLELLVHKACRADSETWPKKIVQAEKTIRAYLEAHPDCEACEHRFTRKDDPDDIGPLVGFTNEKLVECPACGGQRKLPDPNDKRIPGAKIPCTLCKIAGAVPPAVAKKWKEKNR